MPDGNINLKVQLDTNDFAKDLKSLADKSGEVLKILDDAIEAGAVSGLSSLEKVAESSFSKLMQFSEEEKKFLINSSASALKTEQEFQNNISKIREKAASDNLRILSDEELIREDIIKRELSQLKNSLNTGLISQEDYYLKLREYRDKYFEVGSEKWEKYTVEILTFCKENAEKIAQTQKKAILDIYDDLNEKMGQSFQDLIKTQDKMSEKLKDYGSLFYEKSFTSPATKNTYSWLALSDIENEIAILTNYNTALKNAKDLLYKTFPVSKDGIDEHTAKINQQYIKAFFEQLADMSVEEGLTFAAFLTRLPEEKSSDYLNSWAKKQNLAEQISKNLYFDDAMKLYNTNVENMANEMISKLEETFGDLPENFFNEGVAAALGFGDGFMNSIQKVFNNIRSQFNTEFLKLIPSTITLPNIGNTVVENSTSYNIYGNSSAKNTALEIYKYDQLKRMLVGENR